MHASASAAPRMASIALGRAGLSSAPQILVYVCISLSLYIYIYVYMYTYIYIYRFTIIQIMIIIIINIDVVIARGRAGLSSAQRAVGGRGYPGYSLQGVAVGGGCSGWG